LGFALIDDGGFEELTRYVILICMFLFWYIFEVILLLSYVCLCLLNISFIGYFVFSVNANAIEGFGTVFDGGLNTGNFGEISTQAVLDLFQNAKSGEEQVVEIEFEEVEEFNIPRNISDSSGNFVIEINVLLCVCLVFLKI
jgi:hypothetical protein